MRKLCMAEIGSGLNWRLEAERGVDVRAVDGLVAAGGPARTALDVSGVVTTTDQELAGRRLLLIVALQTERLVTGLEHLLVHRAVRVVTGGAIIAQGFVLEDVRPALGFVALQAGVIHGLQLRAATHDGVTLVRIMTVRTGHFARRVRMRQREFAALVQVTLEAGVRVLRRIDDVVDAPTRLRVQAARAVAGFATDVLGVVSRGDQLGVGRVMETTGDGFVTLRAVL